MDTAPIVDLACVETFGVHSIMLQYAVLRHGIIGSSIVMDSVLVGSTQGNMETDK